MIKIMVGVEDLVQRTGDNQAQVGYSMIGWSGGRVMLCAVWFWLQNHRDSFLVWASKPIELRFIGYVTKPTEENMHRDRAACFAWKQVVLGFPSLTSRLVEAWLRVVHVISLWRSCEVEAKDGWVDAMGYIRPFYPKITVFIILCPKDILVL
jgi:hypothetical protein